MYKKNRQVGTKSMMQAYLRGRHPDRSGFDLQLIFISYFGSCSPSVGF